MKSLTSQPLDLNSSNLGKHILNRAEARFFMLRFLATLAFTVGFDILLTGGKYVNAVDQIAMAVVQHF